MWFPVLLLALAAPAAAPTPLAIVNARIAQTDGGSPLPTDFAHYPGETFYLSFEVEGYKANASDAISLESKVEAFDPKGVPIMEPIVQKTAADLAPEDKNWKPKVTHELVIPPLAPSGTYQITINVTDRIGNASARKALSFEVKGHEVAPSDTLVIRNFRYFRNENETQPLTRAAYRPGDAVWARFDITGYKFGPGNKLDVSYQVAVLNSAGKVLWRSPDIPEQHESFYPQHYVPGSGSINLQPTIKPGEYAIEVTAKDLIGNQTCEAKQSFTVE
jgi:hypothetical protein